MNPHDINVYREGRWWMVSIPDIDGLTQARRLSEVEEMARSYIATDLDVPLSTVALGPISIIAHGVDLSDVRTHIAGLRAEAAKAEREAADLAQRTAQTLAGQGVPLRDIGELLGLSYQRAHQLVTS